MDQIRTQTPLLLLTALALATAVVAPHWTGSSGVVMLAILIASVTSSIAGFAFSAICGAMLFHLWANPVQVVQVMMICSIANQSYMVFALRRAIDWRALSRVLSGGVLGLPLGVWLLLNADPHAYKSGLGVFLLAYGIYMLLSRPRPAGRNYPAIDLVAGFLGGITGGAAGFPSIFLTVWATLNGWDKTRQRALVQPFILVMQIAALLGIGLLGRQGGHGSALSAVNLVFIPAGLLGTWLGMACFRRMSNRQFGLAVNALLILSGFSFVL